MAHVIRAATAVFKPQTSITIAVDTAYVVAQQGRSIDKGIYMIDNRARQGSSGEATLDLSTRCNVGNLIGFNVVPINILGGSGDTVVITGFTVLQGKVFTAAGQPRPQSALPGEPAGAYWIGQALNEGSESYQIQIAVTVGVIQPLTCYVAWDSFITAH